MYAQYFVTVGECRTVRAIILVMRIHMIHCCLPTYKTDFLFSSNLLIILSDGNFLDTCLPKRGPMRSKVYPFDICPSILVMQ